MKMNTSKMAMVGVSAIALSMLAFSAQATNLVLNGDFSKTTPMPLTGSQSIYNEVDHWIASNTAGATNARVYLYLPGTATTTGAFYSHGQTAQVVLSGTASDYPTTNGNLVAIDSGYDYTISQTIMGLSPNTQYRLLFDTAAAQQTIASGGSGGDTTDYWQVSLGTDTKNIGSTQNPLFSIPSQGFSGWIQKELIFTTPSTIPSAGEVLTFLGVGMPSGDPPFLLVDNVDLQAVPEPATYALIGIGLLGALFARRQQKKRA